MEVVAAGLKKLETPVHEQPVIERAVRIGRFWFYPQSRAFAELLIDCEEDRALRAVVVGMLREGGQASSR